MKKILVLFFAFIMLNLSVNAKEMRFIQVDNALFNQSSVSNFESLINKINKEKNVDFLVFTGNNISDPRKENLENFIKISKKFDIPYYFVLGNKDVNKSKKLSKNEYFKILNKKVKAHKKIKSPNYVFEKDKVIFIVVDGSKDVIPTSFGYYKTNVLSWLEEQLIKYENSNVIIIQHFPLIPPTKKESYYTYKADEYLEMLSKYDNVKAIISGHFNANSENDVNNILHVTTKNAPAYRIIDILDYETENPSFWSVIKE